MVETVLVAVSEYHGNLNQARWPHQTPKEACFQTPGRILNVDPPQILHHRSTKLQIWGINNKLLYYIGGSTIHTMGVLDSRIAASTFWILPQVCVQKAVAAAVSSGAGRVFSGMQSRQVLSLGHDPKRSHWPASLGFQTEAYEVSTKIHIKWLTITVSLWDFKGKSRIANGQFSGAGLKSEKYTYYEGARCRKTPTWEWAAALIAVP